MKANQSSTSWSPDERASADAQNATVGLAVSVRLAKLNAPQLIDAARQAAADGDAALAGAITDELADRHRFNAKHVRHLDNSTRAEINELLAHVETEAEVAAPHLAAIEAAERSLPMVVGTVRPVDRIAAGLASSGMVNGGAITGND